jgi:hypothetical protein
MRDQPPPSPNLQAFATAFTSTPAMQFKTLTQSPIVGPVSRHSHSYNQLSLVNLGAGIGPLLSLPFNDIIGRIWSYRLWMLVYCIGIILEVRCLAHELQICGMANISGLWGGQSEHHVCGTHHCRLRNRGLDRHWAHGYRRVGRLPRPRFLKGSSQQMRSAIPAGPARFVFQRLHDSRSRYIFGPEKI